MWFLLAQLALAATPVTLTAGLGAAAGPPSLGGYGALHVAWNLGAFGAEIIGREGLYAADPRAVGALVFGARFTRGPAYVRAGFLHHHETPLASFAEAPLRSLIGSGEGIRHRSGLEIGGGLDLPVPERLLDDRLGFVLDLGVGAFPDPQGPHVYVFLEQGWSIDLGRR